MTTSAFFPDGGPLSEEEFFALEEATDRVELFDWSLHVTPAPTPRHQHISRRLANALEAGATPERLHVVEAINVRLKPGRIPIPDVVITSDIDFDEQAVDAEQVLLVCEIVSPSNASADKILKMHYYAEAGIPWYLIVEQETGALHLYRLEGRHYVERSVTKVGDLLHLTDPVDVTIAPEKLLPPR
ncbi:Uma2 family endonuclease [Pseudosporangium ferrugineum]|uniref:Uma2 family endonuclease n=1 Tax=Pseudosporangium ferrugineum TaxID=439699 RepID=A0A2T0S484_9ACTN|nr:Uma2 family endonuclease [Pseudosporangium ferrugineum]PRY28226.1 Uma2 family endonuclease [Pseudosporangium ferrugineum]